MYKKTLVFVFLISVSVVVFAGIVVSRAVRVLYMHPGNQPVIEAIKAKLTWYLAPFCCLFMIGGIVLFGAMILVNERKKGGN